MSDAPPGAVLMTNSTGRVGCVPTTDAAADADGALLAAGVPPHAAPMRRPALMRARNRLPLACNMKSTSTKPYVQAATEAQSGLTGADAKGMPTRRKRGVVLGPDFQVSQCGKKGRHGAC